MPVSHIGLTVSHLPTSSSFFLSALQPLGYRYIGQQGNQVGFGIDEADFFLCQESPGVKPGAAHIAFSAPSRIAVRDFYTAGLTAGGRPHGAPACRNEDTGHFNAAILDFDGNSIEVVFRENQFSDSSSHPGRSKILDWRDDVADTLTENESIERRTSVASVSSITSAAKKALTVYTASQAASSKGTSARKDSVVSSPSISALPAPPAQLVRTGSLDSNASKTLIGTLLGAAAGAAVAYALCKGEEDGARAEADAYESSQASSQRKRSMAQESPRRNFSVTESLYSSPVHRHEQDVRAIEAPPSRNSFHPTYDMAGSTDARLAQFSTYMYVAPTRAAMRNSDRSGGSTSGSSTVKPLKSSAPTLISSFVPDSHSRAPLLLTAGEEDRNSHVSHRSSKSKRESSKAPSKAASRARSNSPSRISRSEHRSRAASVAPSSRRSQIVSRAPSEHRSKAPSHVPSSHHSKGPSMAPSHHPSRAPSPSKAPSEHPSRAPSKVASEHVSKAPSKVGSKAPSRAPNAFDYLEVEVITSSQPAAPRTATPIPQTLLQEKSNDLDIADLDIDDATVVPSDSISQAGSSPSRRSRRSHSPSRSHHSSHSKHSHRSHKTRHTERSSSRRSHAAAPSEHPSRHARAETIFEDAKSRHSMHSSKHSHSSKRTRRDSHHDGSHVSGSHHSHHSHRSHHSHHTRVSKTKDADGGDVVIVTRTEPSHAGSKAASKAASEAGSVKTVKALNWDEKRSATSVKTLPVRGGSSMAGQEATTRGKSVVTLAG